MKRPVRRRPRQDPRTRDTMPLERALDIVELLAAHPAGLTVIEIIARLDGPADEVVHTIAAMQRRQWLRMGSDNEDRPMPIQDSRLSRG